MSDTPLHRAERIAIQSRATLDSQSGSSLRHDKMISEHRELVGALEGLIEYQHGYAKVHVHLTRLAKKLLDAFSTGSNGHRSWMRGIHSDGKTALVLIHDFIRRHK